MEYAGALQQIHSICYCLVDYHTSHLCTGFIGEPSGQLKSSANSFRLLSGPSTRNWAGEWTPVVIRIFIDSAIKIRLLEDFHSQT